MFTKVALAQTTAEELFQKTTQNIVNPIITLFAIASLIFFIYGIFEFIKGAESEDARRTGKKHMAYGIIGLFVIFSVFAIIRVLMNTFGITDVPPVLR